MNDKPGGDRAPDITPDLKKIEWWMNSGLVRSVPLDILKLSGYASSYSSKEVVVAENGEYKIIKAGEMKEGSELLFWPPRDRMGEIELRALLGYYEWMRRTIDSYDARIVECLKTGKMEKVDHLMMEKELCQSPHPAHDSIFNALLDTLKLKATEVGLSEMRQIPNSRLFYLYDRERELNNE